MSELTTSKRKRTTKKNIVLNNILPTCETLLAGEKTDDNVTEALIMLETLTEAAREVKELYDKVSDLMEDDAEYERNETEAYEFALQARKVEGRLQAFVDKPGEAKPTLQTGTSDPIQSFGIKMPEIKIDDFDGDPLKWRTFIESFDALVHVRRNISSIQKYTWLRGYLKGSARQTIEGLPLTSDNYVKAKELLEKRYGNKQLIVSSHMDALLCIDKCVTANAKELRNIHDKVELNIRALGTAGVAAEQIGPLLIPIVLKTLPNVVRLQISRELGTDNWGMEEFMACLNEEVSARENFEFLKNAEYRDELPEKSDRDQRTVKSLAVGAKVCVFCGNKSHYSDKCDVVTETQLRKEKLREIKCCFKCLKDGHIARNCSKKVFCFRCKAKNRHNTAVCDKSLRSADQQLVTKSDKSVVLQTANGFLADKQEQKMEEVSILLDNCSQQTFVSDKIVKKLGLSPVSEKNRKINAFGSEKGKGMRLKEYEIVLKPGDKSSSIYINALSIPIICAPVCRTYVQLAKEQNEFLKALKLADNGGGSSDVDMLIGADVYWDIVTGNLKRNPNTGFVAISSSLGWLMNGPVIEPGESNEQMNMAVAHVLSIQGEKCANDILAEEISAFWRLDLLGVADVEKDDDCEKLINIRYENWRYKVDLPEVQGHQMLPDNYTLSHRRLKGLKKTMDEDMDFKKSYDEIMKDQLKCSVIEEVKDSGTVGRVTYLPHRAVIREDKSTTKMRIVFDGGAKRKGQISLNDILHKGPALNPSIFELVVKFRIYDIVLTADIEKAYLQIEIDEMFRDFLRFIYYKDVFADEKNLEIAIMRFCRVTFGITPSQYILNAVVRKHGERYEKVDPEFARMTRNHFYIDDLNTGAKTVKKGHEIYKKTKIRFCEANFNVRKWRTNSEELRNLIFEEDRSVEEDGKVLGVKWNHINDTIHMSVKRLFEMAKDVNPTKRSILKIIAAVYDPVGFIAPISTSLKLLFQEVWQTNIGWDEHVGEEMEKKWRNIVKMLSTYVEMCLQRRYFIDDISDPIKSVYLHGYSDAAEKAFGTCIYVQAVTTSGNIQVSFVAAKTRVKPLRKELSMPRMELLGNLVLAKLMNVVYTTLSEETKVDDYFCWTDSRVTLAWIKASNRVFKVFVQNRLNKIRENSEPNKWNYCNTKDNPADLITRFYTGDLAKCKLWTEGPEILKNFNYCGEQDNVVEYVTSDKSSKSGGEPFMINCVQLNQEEIKSYYEEIIDVVKSNTDVSVEINDNTSIRSNIMITTSRKNNDAIINNIPEVGKLIDVIKYSNFSKLLNVTAWVLRFGNNARLKKSDRILCEYITAEERNTAWIMWVKVNQCVLTSNEKYEEIKCSLNLVKDDDGIINALGRIQRANTIPESRRKPIMLERAHKLAELIVLECHGRVKHNGVRETLVEFQSQYWVTKGHSFVKNILHRCVLCRYFNSRPYGYPRSPELPKLRLKDKKAFTVTGADHFGPLYCKSNFRTVSIEDEDQLHKCHVVLYTCASSRGIILDLVSDTSSKEFINSLKRFIARRGCPQVILSDHGGAFTATDTQRFVAERSIIWKFMLTKAPWHGAIWERLVQSTKRCLKKVVGRTTLNFVELQTVLLEIETILNSRPLCPLYSDDMDEPLTPNHLLFGQKLSQTNVQAIDIEVGVNLKVGKKRVDYIESIVQHYWDRWRKEYVVSLRAWKQKYKKRNASTPEVDDIVLIFEEKVPRQSWCMGRIVEILPSRDGQIRGARIVVGKTKEIIERPVSKLYPIEFASEGESRRNSQNDNTVEVITEDTPSDYARESTSTENVIETRIRPKRSAAILADEKIKYVK